jgi:hypothetical protein
MSARVIVAGEKAVEEDLTREGYKVTRNTAMPGSPAIDAVKGSDHRLIQVKTGKYPNNPDNLSVQEVGDIKSQATRIGAIAYSARVWLDRNNNILHSIEYKKL